MIRSKNKPGGTASPLTTEEKAWIDAHCHNTTVVNICNKLRRQPRTIYEYLDEKGVQAYSSRPELPRRAVHKKPAPDFFDDSKMQNLLV